MSNTTEKKPSQREIELLDFNSNFSFEKEFSEDENKKNFDNLEYDEKNQRIIQKEYLFDWIISICNKFLIGVSLVFCMFMFEIKNSFLELNTLIMFLTLIIFIFYKIALHFFPNLPKKIQIFKPSENEIKYFKAIIFLFSIIILYKIIDIRNLKDIIYLPTIIITLITSTTATIIGLPAIVAMAIFRSEKKKKKERENEIFD
jgi:ABC-type phosphate transport system permease subunit